MSHKNKKNRPVIDSNKNPEYFDVVVSNKSLVGDSNTQYDYVGDSYTTELAI